MTDEESGSGDRILRLTGVVLVVAVIAALGVIVLAGANLPGGGESPPDANWSITRVNDSYASIEHVGGEPVRVSALVVSVDGKIRQLGWSGSLTRGDRVVIPVQRGQSVRIFWEGSPGERTLLENEQL